MTNTAPHLHGPGGLLATPGLGARKRRRKWGQRLKESGYGARAGQTIRGNLARGGDGKFTAAGNASAATPKRGIVLSRQPKPKPKPVKATPKPKPAGGGKKPAGARPKDPAVTARQQQRDEERAADRATRAADREQRQADRAERRAKQQQRERERLAKDMQRAADATKKPEPKKAAGGGGSKKPAEKPDKATERAKRAAATAAQVGLQAADVQALQQAAEMGGASSPALAALGLVGADGVATDQGRRALSALERGDVRQYQAAVQDAQARMGREQGATDRRQQAETRRSAAAQAKKAKQQEQIARLKRQALSGGRLSDTERATLEDAGVMDATGRWTGKSFAVWKDHRGQHRWIARTTTAYRDRDGEIISADALDADSQRMMATKQFGPLRWWHVGQPDPANVAAPWGPGLDIGDCDYSVVIGRTRIESGTFRDSVIAQKMAGVADRLEMSPGFFHPLDQPDSGKVFHSIRTFERSPVPIRYGRASNLFTGFTVKEFRMDIAEMERRFKAMYQELGLTPEQGVQLGQQLVATEKAAVTQGIAFKSDAAPPEEITINGVVYTVKAAPPFVADEPPVDVKADDGIEALAEDIVEPVEPTGEFVGDLTPDAFFARLDEHLAPLIKMQEMVKSLSDGVGELKSMSSGTATKDAGINAELTALKAQQQALAQQIAQIEGQQPATILPEDVAEALKSAGPTVPDAPREKPIESTPERPWAIWGAQTFPELYAENGHG